MPRARWTREARPAKLARTPLKARFASDLSRLAFFLALDRTWLAARRTAWWALVMAALAAERARVIRPLNALRPAEERDRFDANRLAILASPLPTERLALAAARRARAKSPPRFGEGRVWLRQVGAPTTARFRRAELRALAADRSGRRLTRRAWLVLRVTSRAIPLAPLTKLDRPYRTRLAVEATLRAIRPKRPFFFDRGRETLFAGMETRVRRGLLLGFIRRRRAGFDLDLALPLDLLRDLDLDRRLDLALLRRLRFGFERRRGRERRRELRFRRERRRDRRRREERRGERLESLPPMPWRMRPSGVVLIIAINPAAKATQGEEPAAGEPAICLRTLTPLFPCCAQRRRKCSTGTTCLPKVGSL